MYMDWIKDLQLLSHLRHKGGHDVHFVIKVLCDSSGWLFLLLLMMTIHVRINSHGVPDGWEDCRCRCGSVLIGMMAVSIAIVRHVVRTRVAVSCWLCAVRGRLMVAIAALSGRVVSRMEASSRIVCSISHVVVALIVWWRRRQSLLML
jgi:hypothetical protein